MTGLTVTAAISTGFTCDYVYNSSIINWSNDNARYNCNNSNNTVCNNNNQNYCSPNPNIKGCSGYRR